MANELKTAYTYCQQVAKERAKNFYYAFRTLPSRKRRAIYATYAFCRLCDDIADGTNTLQDKKFLFDQTYHLLREAVKNRGAKDPVFLALQDTIHTFQIPHHYLEEVIEGVELDLTKTRFQNFAELKNYCYNVASVVGLICIEVFEYKDPKAKKYAVDLGLAMQLTNILRDIREDAERGRIYLPLDEMSSFGYSETNLLDGVITDDFLCLMRFQADRARKYFASGQRLLPLLSPRSRACPAVLHGMYSALLDLIENSRFDVFQQRIRLSKNAKLLLTAKLWAQSMIQPLPPGKR